MALALFDLDNTLLAGDSDYLWGVFLAEQGLVDKDIYEKENQRFYDEYKQGKLDIMEFLAFSLKPLADNDLGTLLSLREKFLQSIIQPLMSPASFELIEKHKQQGDTLLVITATNSFVTAPIVEAFGIPNLLATEPEKTPEGYTGRVAGTPCFQDGKVIRLNEWMKENNCNLDNSWFYSDSRNDLPLLEIVANPVAVDPDDHLRETASKRGWPVISLREQAKKQG